MPRPIPAALVTLALLAWSGVAVGRASLVQDPGAPAGMFYCPMHPDITAKTEASCSRCGMKLVPGDPLDAREYLLDMKATPPAVQPGQPVRLAFTVRHPDTRAIVFTYATVHEKQFHLFVVSHDLVSIFSIADRIVMLYRGKVRLIGTRDEFQRTSDGVVDQFIHGRASGPMEAYQIALLALYLAAEDPPAAFRLLDEAESVSRRAANPALDALVARLVDPDADLDLRGLIEGLDSLVPMLDLAIELHPKEPQFYAGLCEVYLRKEMKEKATEACKKALEIDPNFASAQELMKKLIQ